MISDFLNDLMLVFFLCVGSSILSLIIGIISIFTGNYTSPSHPDVHVDVHVQTPPSQQTQPQEQWPSIAEQFDGRLTNIFRNTWEGIL